MARVLVVGSGIAGLSAAIAASRRHDVTLVTKADLAETATRRAQGGIAAALTDDDSPALHAADTRRAGAGLTDAAAVDALCSDGPERVLELAGLGVGFDRDGDAWARGLEAAHSRARILHAGGDATGAAIEAALVAVARRVVPSITEHAFLADLLVEDGRACGARLLMPDGSARTCGADAVILATGGAGRLFSHTTNPAVATGDGAAAALRAGAVLTDLEFYQFHPTALADGDGTLVSEAVRGEGAVLVNAEGERFMTAVHPDAELAPRDVVARGIADEMARRSGAPVLLDATALGARFLARRFPTIDAACRAHGHDWARRPVPVTPAAHYWMGGVRTDTAGRTNLPGLYAVGEVACTGVHGANRLASNSLLEGLVFAHRAVRDLDAPGSDPWSGRAAPGAPGRQRIVEPAVSVPSEAVVPRAGGTRAALQRLMWDAAGIRRTHDGLEAAAAVIAGWRAGVEPHTVAEHETANLLTLAAALVAAASARCESRGAHFRADFPEPSDDAAPHLAVALDAERKAALAC